MRERTKYLAIAVSLTVLDGVVALHCGSVVWRTWSAILWSRMVILLLAAVWAVSLANIWARAFHELRRAYSDRRIGLMPNSGSIARELRGGGDV